MSITLLEIMKISKIQSYCQKCENIFPKDTTLTIVMVGIWLTIIYYGKLAIDQIH